MAKLLPRRFRFPALSPIQRWLVRWFLLVSPLLVGAGLLISMFFWPVPEADLSVDGHIALRLGVLLGTVTYAGLMRLAFYSHESGLDDKVDHQLSAIDDTPIRAWES